MSYDEQIEIIENDVLIVAVTNNDDSYFMWQKGLTEETGKNDGIYFEFDDQINSGHNIVKECTVANDGIHVVLTNDKLEHFYFPSGFDKIEELKIALNKIYTKHDKVLKFSI